MVSSNTRCACAIVPPRSGAARIRWSGTSSTTQNDPRESPSRKRSATPTPAPRSRRHGKALGDGTRSRAAPQLRGPTPLSLPAPRSGRRILQPRRPASGQWLSTEVDAQDVVPASPLRRKTNIATTAPIPSVQAEDLHPRATRRSAELPRCCRARWTTLAGGFTRWPAHPEKDSSGSPHAQGIAMRAKHRIRVPAPPRHRQSVLLHVTITFHIMASTGRRNAPTAWARRHVDPATTRRPTRLGRRRRHA